MAAAHTFLELYLHDDFYDKDGNATQFQEQVVSPEAFPAPTLEQARQDSEKLLDYAFSRWSLKDDVIQALLSHEKKPTLVESLRRRVSDSLNPNVEGRAYEICAALGPAAESWIRERWHNYHPDLILQLIKTTAECLPASEGLLLALKGLEAVPEIRLVDTALALAYFQSPQTLDWMEEHVAGPDFISWAQLAALSRLSWKRVCEWLSRGRPLSLLALLALNYCWNYNTRLLRKFRPKLLQPESHSVMTQTLDQYISTDPEPLIHYAAREAVSHWDELCEGTDSL